MEIIRIGTRLHLIKPAFGQVYVWQDGSELTLIDTGIAGSAPDLGAAFAELGSAAVTCAGSLSPTATRTTRDRRPRCAPGATQKSSPIARTLR